MPYSSDHPVTLGGLLSWRAAAAPGQTALVFVRGDGGTDPMTYGRLHSRSLRLAGLLRERGAAHGDRVLIGIPPGPDYVTAFFGCQYAGCVAVPVYPPRGSRHDERLGAVADDARPALALGSREIAERAARSGITTLPWLAVTDADDVPEPSEPVGSAASDLAFLQYTSGSTGAPKGVMVSHRAVLANIAMISANFALSGEDVAVSWLPPYHDMGLVGGLLTPVHAGIPCVLLTPAMFAQTRRVGFRRCLGSVARSAAARTSATGCAPSG